MRKLKVSQEIESSVQSAATVAADGKSSKGSKEMRISTFIPALDAETKR
jgi:hypothetical protein